MIVAGVVVAIVVASGLYVTNLPLSSNKVNQSYPTFAQTTDSMTGLELKLGLNSTILGPDAGIAINITELNTRNFTNIINASNAWPVEGLALGPCGTLNYPTGVGIFKGYYTQTNITSAGKELSLYQPGEYMCPMFLMNISFYKFKPLSDSAQVFASCNSQCLELNVSSKVEAGGYLSSSTAGRTFTSFSPGMYTVVGGDEWGQILLLHFTVGESPSLTTETTITSTQSGAPTTSSFAGMVLTTSRTYSYDNIPWFEFVGNFGVQLVHNGTGYFPANNSSGYNGFSFALNVTTPEPKSSYFFFEWTPPCSASLATHCEANNEIVLPTPENATVSYHSETLLILWYKNSTGLYISFQQYQPSRSTVVTLSASGTPQQGTGYTTSTTTECSIPTPSLAGSQTSIKSTNNQTATLNTYTTVSNPCG